MPELSYFVRPDLLKGLNTKSGWSNYNWLYFGLLVRYWTLYRVGYSSAYVITHKLCILIQRPEKTHYCACQRFLTAYAHIGLLGSLYTLQAEVRRTQCQCQHEVTSRKQNVARIIQQGYIDPTQPLSNTVRIAYSLRGVGIPPIYTKATTTWSGVNDRTADVWRCYSFV